MPGIFVIFSICMWMCCCYAAFGVLFLMLDDKMKQSPSCLAKAGLGFTQIVVVSAGITACVYGFVALPVWLL